MGGPAVGGAQAGLPQPRSGDFGTLWPQSHPSPEPSVCRDVHTHSRVYLIFAGWGLTLPLLVSLGHMHSAMNWHGFFSSLLKRMPRKKETCLPQEQGERT